MVSRSSKAILIDKAYKTLNLDLAQILFAAGMFYEEILPDFACALLENDNDTPAIRELAGLNRPTLGDVNPIVERMFKELGKPSLQAIKDPNTFAPIIARLVINSKISTADAVDIGGRYYFNIADSDNVDYRNQNLTALEGFEKLLYAYMDDDSLSLRVDRKSMGDRNKDVIEYCHILLQDQEK